MQCPATCTHTHTQRHGNALRHQKTQGASVRLKLSSPLHSYCHSLHHKEDTINCLIQAPTVTLGSPAALTLCQSSPQPRPDTGWQRWRWRTIEGIESTKQLISLKQFSLIRIMDSRGKNGPVGWTWISERRTSQLSATMKGGPTSAWPLVPAS